MKSTKSCSVRSQDAAGPPRRLRYTVRSGVLLLGALAVLSLTGCQADSIQDYKVPKQKAPSTEVRRLLVLITAHGDKTWFFKLLGPTAAVTAQEKTFIRFLQSIHFDGDEARWTVPDGWQEQRGGGMRYATLRRVQGTPLEITVFSFGHEAAKILENINRWRRLDLNLEPIGREGLAKVARPFKIDGEQAILIDMDSRAEAAPADEEPAEREPAGNMTYKVPEGWKKAPAAGFPGMTAFVIQDGDQKVRFTILPMPAVSGVLKNVNRWRDTDFGLPPIDEKQLGKETRTLEVDGIKSTYVDLTGQGAGAQRVLGVLVPQGGQLWSFKMKGPADLVSKQKAAFEAFMKSVKFGGRGGADE